jgi:large subunit ribosomal protein L10
MPTEAKVALVKQIQEELTKANAVWIVDYRGLTVKQAEELRGVIRKEGATLKIYKNSFTQRALADAALPAMDDVLAGPSAFVFVEGDPVASAKALKVFAKGHEALQIKGGLLDKQIVTAEQIKAIADLPSREELIAKLLGTLQNPLTGLVRVLNGPAEKFVRTLQAVADQKAA